MGLTPEALAEYKRRLQEAIDYGSDVPPENALDVVSAFEARAEKAEKELAEAKALLQIAADDRENEALAWVKEVRSFLAPNKGEGRAR